MKSALCLIVLLCLPPAGLARAIHYGAVTDAALLDCDQQSWRGRRDAAGRCYRGLLDNASPWVRAEALWALGDVKGANESFGAAAGQRPTAALLTRWGELFAEMHQNAEALNLFKDALQADADYAFAKVGAASVLVDQFAAQADTYLQPVIASANAPAGAKLRALLLAARVHLENGDTESAARLLAQATDVAGGARLPRLEIYALQTALELLQSATDIDVSSGSWVKKALAENPGYGDIYAIPARFYVLTRRTRAAMQLYRKAVEVQPDNWAARVAYGSSLLRDNQISAAREQMEAAYQGDPYNVVTVNTLRLLDSLQNFDVLIHPDLTLPDAGASQANGAPAPMILRLHKQESAVLGPYVRKLTEAAIATFSKQFNFKLQEPVVIEMYPDHEDFAVRTAGEPGLGLLGVTFGYVAAMDSPSSRAVDEFHWGSTLWHELAHVFTLEATGHRVPRWFSEGISVHEEWNTGPIQGISIPAYAYAAFRDGKALPIAELDRGFIRPEYPQQVVVSYMQAGLICEFIKRGYGAGKLNDMLNQFKHGQNTEQALRAVFNLQPKEFDARFNAFMQDEFKILFAEFDVWRDARSSVAAAYKRSEWTALIQAAQAALSILPNDVEDGSPYVALARAYNATNRTDQAQAALETFFRHGGHDPQALRWLATRLRAQHRVAEAAQVLSAINYVTPFDYEVHGELGEALLALKRADEALTEFQVALKLNPPDKATAHYRVALALRDLQRGAEAKRNVLLALEIAPGFRPAQQLLLALREK